jgi:DNA end-binding protein Ku
MPIDRAGRQVSYKETTRREFDMTPRAYWKGFLRLSLVTCPIELYPATSQSEKTHFHQINTQTGHRLRQQMVDEATNKVVDKAHKGRGYELAKGRYVQIDEDELAAVEIESTHTIDIDSFVPLAEIDRRYLDKPYYIVPSGKIGAEAFVVIRDAMKDKDRVGLARIVMANREHIIALEPHGKGLLGTTLRYDYEVRDERPYYSGVPGVRVGKEMLALAEHILDTKASHFDPTKFKDEYELALRKLVKRKAAGKKIEAPEPAEDSGKVIDLMEALRRSIHGARAPKPATRGSKKKREARGRKAA